jgi:hypothetical protein
VETCGRPFCAWITWVGDGMLSSRLFLLAEREPRGLGLRLRRLPIGLVNPLRLRSKIEVAGASTATRSSPRSSSCSPVRISAALSRTDGTDWSRCSVALARGIRWGFGGRCDVPEGDVGETIGSMSRSNIAEEDECLEVMSYE